MKHPQLGHDSVLQTIDNAPIKPLLQVLDIEKIITSLGERYRLVLSDSTHYIQGMLAVDISHLAQNESLIKYSIIRLNEFVCNNIYEKRICVVIQCEIVQDYHNVIGKPISYINWYDERPISLNNEKFTIYCI